MKKNNPENVAVEIENLKSALKYEQSRKKRERMPLYEAYLEFSIKALSR